jgi:hypothetical protein
MATLFCEYIKTTDLDTLSGWILWYMNCIKIKLFKK